MKGQKAQIIIFDDRGDATVYPRALIDPHSTVGDIIQDIKKARDDLQGEYEMYIRVDNLGITLDDLPLEITSFAILPVAPIRRRRVVDLGE